MNKADLLELAIAMFYSPVAAEHYSKHEQWLWLTLLYWAQE